MDRMHHVSSVVFPDTYRDSVFLMKISGAAKGMEGVEAVSAMMGTPRNKELFESSGLMTPTVRDARQDDLMVSLRGREDAVASALDAVRAMLSDTGPRPGVGAAYRPRTVIEARRAEPELNMALISVPGEYAAYEAFKALEQGLNVMVYSDNVSLEDEARLKAMAAYRGLLFMGPDCGTALIGGVPLGFANRVRPGGVGVVGASGTGAQQVMCLVDRLGGGISHCIGVGGRDLKDAIGGTSTLHALELLDADPATRVIALVGKPPGPRTTELLARACARLGKPVVVHFVGGPGLPEGTANITWADSLEQAAVEACLLLPGLKTGRAACEALLDADGQAGPPLPPAPERRWLRGVYCGGTLCLETLAVAAKAFPGTTWSNLGLEGVSRLPDSALSREHTCVDLGDDEFSLGRPHPMIDPAARLERLHAELTDPGVAVVLLDVVIGHGACPDQAEGIAQTLARAQADSGGRSREVAVLASVCGTSADTPPREAVEAALARAGVRIFSTNARAARAALALLQEHNA